MKIVDFHAHAFPDHIAAKAIPMLEAEGGIKACLNGTISALLESMDRCGIDASLVCSIATKPSQFDPILDWSARIRSDRIIPLPSFHPSDPRWSDRIRRTRADGFSGIKLHPYYQDFSVDDPHLFPMYELMAKEGLFLLLHTGFDFAFERVKKADPTKILLVLDRIPELKLITTHLGAWEEWDEVESMLLGKNICMETSFSLDYLPQERARMFFNRHPADFLIFGSDSPWADQAVCLRQHRQLGLEPNRLDKILGGNACRLLGIS